MAFAGRPGLVPRRPEPILDLPVALVVVRAGNERWSTASSYQVRRTRANAIVGCAFPARSGSLTAPWRGDLGRCGLACLLAALGRGGARAGSAPRPELRLGQLGEATGRHCGLLSG